MGFGKQGRRRRYGRGRHGRGHGAHEHGFMLDRVRPGERVEVLSVGDDDARIQAVRLGIGEGSEVTCVTKLPCGPVILKSGLQEIAVGRGLACDIVVRPARGGESHAGA